MRCTLAVYLLRRTLRGLLIAFLIVFALLALVDFVEGTRDAGSDSALGGLQIFTLTLLETPSLLEQTLPFIALFAAIGTLNALNRRSELIAARAAGLSAWRYLKPAIATAFALGVVWVVVGNPLAVAASSKAEAMREAVEATSFRNEGSIWIRDPVATGRAVLHAQELDLEVRRLATVTYYGFAPGVSGDRFIRRIDAETAQYLPTGYWQLSGVREWAGGAYGYPVNTLALPSGLSESDLLDQIERQGSAMSRTRPVWELPAVIASQRRAGYSTTLPRMAFWKLMALPVLLTGMTIIGANVSMRMSREGGTWRLILAGGVVGFGVYFASVFVEAFGEVGTLPPLIATWTMPLLAVAGGLFGLANLEDG